jgi:uncharacterized protein (DUF1330 family)
MAWSMGNAAALVLGAAAAALLQSAAAAQQKAPAAYVIAEQEIVDADAAREFTACVGPTQAPFHPTPLVRGGKTDAISGTPPKRVIVIQFADAATARAWVDSPAHQTCQPLQDKAMHERAFIVEGLPGQ